MAIPKDRPELNTPQKHAAIGNKFHAQRLGEEATATLEPFAARQHLLRGLLALLGISKCVASSFGRSVAREHSHQ